MWETDKTQIANEDERGKAKKLTLILEEENGSSSSSKVLDLSLRGSLSGVCERRESKVRQGSVEGERRKGKK